MPGDDVTESVKPAAAATNVRAEGWLGTAPVDAALAFAWLAFYAWIGTTPLVDVAAKGSRDWRTVLDTATTIAFGINFIHRHFVYLLFFGDRAQRERHPRAFWFLPAALLVVVTLQFAAPSSMFDKLLWILAGWNVWHTLMQRHGIFRAYAARSGIAATTSGRLDLALLWSLALATAGAVIAFDQDTFAVAAIRAWRAIPFLPAHRDAQLALFAVTALVAFIVATLWLKREFSTSPTTSRIPRCFFLASTLALFAVFVAHGPIVGFLVFSSAHAVEYVLFVYLYTKKRAADAASPVAIRVLGRTLPLAILSASLVGVFLAVHQVWTVPAVVAYYTTTSALHYLYDGLIWKMRRPEVRAPIAAA